MNFAAQVTFLNDTESTISAEWYEWDGSFLLFFTNDSMDFFDKDNLKVVVINGKTITIPN